MDPFQAVAGVTNACQILPHVITGGQPTAAQLKALKEAGGAIILDARDPMEPRPFDEKATAQQLGLEYVNIPINSAALEDATIDRILELLRKSGDKTVFFHCSSGNRVAGALIPWFMMHEGMDESEAVNQAMRVGLRSPEVLEWGLEYARKHMP